MRNLTGSYGWSSENSSATLVYLPQCLEIDDSSTCRGRSERTNSPLHPVLLSFSILPYLFHPTYAHIPLGQSASLYHPTYMLVGSWERGSGLISTSIFLLDIVDKHSKKERRFRSHKFKFCPLILSFMI